MADVGWDTEKHPGPGVWLVREDGKLERFAISLAVALVGPDGNVTTVGIDQDGVQISTQRHRPAIGEGVRRHGPCMAWDYEVTP